MHLFESGTATAPMQLRALAMVGRAATNGLGRPQRAFLDAVQRVVLGTQLDLDAVEPVTFAALAGRVSDPALGRQLVRLMVVLSLADGPPSAEQMSLMRGFAAALRIDEPAVDVFGHLAQGRLVRFRLAFLRRSHLRAYFRNTRRLQAGRLAVLRALLRFRGVLPEDRASVSRFRALESLPEDSLGHRFFRHCVDAGLPFPGAKGGFPAGAIFHDFAHVLAGYDTSPEGEMKAAAFQAGFTHGDHDFFTWLFSVVIHTAGVNVAPLPMPVLPGRIGRNGLAQEVLEALARGTAVKEDLGDGWDFWAHVEEPLEVARERLGVPPIALSA